MISIVLRHGHDLRKKALAALVRRHFSDGSANKMATQIGPRPAVPHSSDRASARKKARDDLEAVFKAKVDQYAGGSRNLAHVLEGSDLRFARRKGMGPELAEFLQRY